MGQALLVFFNTTSKLIGDTKTAIRSAPTPQAAAIIYASFVSEHLEQ
jgi:hypothetical protein